MIRPTLPIKIFIAYSRFDGNYLEELRKYLRPLNRKKTIQIWYDGEIGSGTQWAAKINQHLNTADIILLFISPNFLDSDYFYNEEMKKILECHEKGEAKLIPVILQHCNWRLFKELNELQAFPKNGLPISHWSNDAEAYTNVVEELYEVVISTRTAKGKKMAIAQKEAAIRCKKEEVRLEKIEQEKFVKLPQAIQELIQNMVTVEGGSFQMGMENYAHTRPVHKVNVPNFQIAKYPVTQIQWKAVMGNNPSHFKDCDNCPVEEINWNDSKEFIQELNQLTGKQFRLPSEAEWEFAARGGNKSLDYTFSGSNKIDEVAWYWKNGHKKTHPVGEKKANELGLYDMSGNIWEWCEDDWHSNYENAPENGSTWVDQPRNKRRRIVRGGSWNDNSDNRCRVASRYHINAFARADYYGLRLVLSQF